MKIKRPYQLPGARERQWARQIGVKQMGNTAQRIIISEKDCILCWHKCENEKKDWYCLRFTSFTKGCPCYVLHYEEEEQLCFLS